MRGDQRDRDAPEDLSAHPERREREDVRRQLGRRERLIAREPAEQLRNHERRRIERQYIAQRGQQQCAECKARAAAQLCAIAPHAQAAARR